MIQINNISKQFSGKDLFKNLSFNIQKGERCGLVGRNGSGKSTLFSLILNKLSPDSGEIVSPKHYKIGHLEQHIKFTKSSVLEECCQVLPSELQYETFRAEKILTGLGFTQDDLQKDPLSFSGGYQIRINLCKSLLTEPNLLLLDEPTNYLDILSLRWLKKFLNSYDGEVIIITHDRSFMDSVTTHTMGIHRNGLIKIKGDTNKYYQQLAEQEEIHEKTRINQEKKIAHLEAFVERFSAKASKATQAQSKQKQLEKMTVLSKLSHEDKMGLEFQFQKCPGKIILSVSNLSFKYSDEFPILFKNLNFSIGHNDKIGIIGKNGKGKSTLLNLIANELQPTTGTIEKHPSYKQGHLGQTNVSRLSDSNTIFHEIQSSNLELSNTKIRNICGSLMFKGEDADKKIQILSGGEKNRVLLGKIMANPTNILLLDEPTNHLDMESIEILTEEIQNYEGAAIIVTHSEELLRQTVNKLIIFDKEQAHYFLGGYDDFLEKIGWNDEEKTEAIQKDKSNLTKKEIHALRSEIIKRRAKILNPLKEELEDNEKKLIELESNLETVTQSLEAASNSGDNDLIFSASKEIGIIEKNINDIFENMENLEEKIILHTKEFDKELNQIEN